MMIICVVVLLVIVVVVADEDISMARGGSFESPPDLPDTSFLKRVDNMVYELQASSFQPSEKPAASGCTQFKFDTWVSLDLTRLFYDSDKLLTVELDSNLADGAGLEAWVELDASWSSKLADLIEWASGYQGLHFIGDLADSLNMGNFRPAFCPYWLAQPRPLSMSIPLITPKTIISAFGAKEELGNWDTARLLLRVGLNRRPVEHASRLPRLTLTLTNNGETFRQVVEAQWRLSGKHFDPDSHWSLSYFLWSAFLVVFYALTCVAGCMYMSGRYVLWKKFGWKGLTHRADKFM